MNLRDAWRALWAEPSEPAPEPKRDALGPTDEQHERYLAGMAAAEAKREINRCICGLMLLPNGSPVTDFKGVVHDLSACNKPAPPDDFECPECACKDFTMGGQTARVNRTGARPHGQVLTCLGCGARWYNTGRGLKHPHESALPPAWAMADLQGRAAKAQADAQLAREQRLKQAMSQHPQTAGGPTAGFRKPPAPEPS